MRLPFEYKRLHPRAVPFAQATPGSAGYDVAACIDEPITLRFGEAAQLIPTGLAIHILDPNICAVIIPRSGLGHKSGLICGNGVGLIDADFAQQWFVSAWLRGPMAEVVIKPGDRIAQVVFLPVIHPEFREVEEFTVGTERLGGFGSTGVSQAGAKS